MITVKYKNIEVFTYGKYTFYTDKHAIAVRVPRAGALEQFFLHFTPHIEVGEKLAKYNYTPSHDGKWFDLKELYCPECDGYTGRWHICSPYVKRPALLVCDICGGTGRRHICPECDGDGKVDISPTATPNMMFMCRTCDGKGIATDPKNPDGFPCLECNSTGAHGYANYGCVRLHNDYDEYLNAAYLDALVELPGIQIFMPRLEDYSIFKFAGGSAVLMGMTPPSD